VEQRGKKLERKLTMQTVDKRSPAEQTPKVHRIVVLHSLYSLFDTVFMSWHLVVGKLEAIEELSGGTRLCSS
jgi:hypothetical protein